MPKFFTQKFWPKFARFKKSPKTDFSIFCDFDGPRTPRESNYFNRGLLHQRDLVEIFKSVYRSARLDLTSRSSRPIKIGKNENSYYPRQKSLFFRFAKLLIKTCSNRLAYTIKFVLRLLNYKTWCSDRLGIDSSTSSRQNEIGQKSGNFPKNFNLNAKILYYFNLNVKKK